jgi:preprotein translocase subunit SecY
MIDFFRQIAKTPEVRKKVLIVLGLLIVFRVAAHIPVPGVDLTNLKKLFEGNQFLGLLNLFSGGGISSFSIVLMGVAPFINASIMVQLLTILVPKFEQLQKEGEAGRTKLNQYTRMLTVPLASLQAFGMIKLLQSQARGGAAVLPSISLTQTIAIILIITAGTIFLMWLGELISEQGIGNGISLIIFAGIVSRIPSALGQIFSTIDQTKILGYLAFLAIAIAVVAAVVLANEGQRNIPIQYARRVRGQRLYGSTDTHLPIRILTAGVIPIIFALSIMLLPSMLGNFFAGAKSSWVANSAHWIQITFQNQTLYSIVYFALVVGFTFFYTSVIFRPKDVAENIQKQGGFIPGIRPGTQTREYLGRVINRITLPGAVFLGAIAVLPFIIQIFNLSPSSNLAIGGTGLLIVVSVALDTIRQIKAQLVMRQYDVY